MTRPVAKGLHQEQQNRPDAMGIRPGAKGLQYPWCGGTRPGTGD